MSKNLGEKFRYRVGFNLAKESLLGLNHCPHQLQEKLFLMKLSESKFADVGGEIKLDARTFRDGWHGIQKPQIKKQNQLDEIVVNGQNQNLIQWQNRLNKSKQFQNPNRKSEFLMHYFPGVVTQPSLWINKVAINDVLHEHLCALEARCLISPPQDKILACESILAKIHNRWDPNGQNCFFDYLDITKSDYVHIKSDGYTKKNENPNELNLTRLDLFIKPAISEGFFNPMSHVSVCQFLAMLPIANDIRKHPLLDFWILQFSSSILAIQGFSDGLFWKIGDSYRDAREVDNILLAGNELFWGELDIKFCLRFLDIQSNNNFYNDYYNAFSLFRARYIEILNEFGFSVSEFQDIFNDYALLELNVVKKPHQN